MHTQFGLTRLWKGRWIERAHWFQRGRRWSGWGRALGKQKGRPRLQYVLGTHNCLTKLWLKKAKTYFLVQLSHKINFPFKILVVLKQQCIFLLFLPQPGFFHLIINKRKDIRVKSNTTTGWRNPEILPKKILPEFFAVPAVFWGFSHCGNITKNISVRLYHLWTPGISDLFFLILSLAYLQFIHIQIKWINSWNTFFHSLLFVCFQAVWSFIFRIFSFFWFFTSPGCRKHSCLS